MENPISARRIPFWSTVLLALALWLYEGVRACTVGFTHDEAGTYAGFANETVRDLFFHERNWTWANNHLLNTLCMQLGHRWFGPQEWALRWGSVAAGLIFLVYAFRTVRLWLPGSAWLGFAAFSLMTLNHFVVDFFSLCRGYGLQLAFEMGALFYFFRWIDRENRFDPLKASTALCLGILANFTLLDLLAAFFATVSLALFLRRQDGFSITHWLRFLALPLLPVLATLALIYRPMVWIKARGELDYGAPGFWETWRVLVERFVYEPLVAVEWLKVVILVMATAVVVFLGYSIFRRFRSEGPAAHPPLFYATVLTALTMLATAAQHYLLGSDYLIGRTALLFYPLISSVVVLYLIDLNHRHPRARRVWITATALVALNFLASLNLRKCREWAYDENTREAVVYANSLGSPDHRLRYGVGWLYCPATLFYQQQLGLINIETVEYNLSHDDAAWIRDKAFDLIYIDEKLRPALEDRYETVREYPAGVMMRR